MKIKFYAILLFMTLISFFVITASEERPKSSYGKKGHRRSGSTAGEAGLRLGALDTKPQKKDSITTAIIVGKPTKNETK